MENTFHLFLTDQTAAVLSNASASLFGLYLVLQIIKHRFMWYVYIPSCLFAFITYADSTTWAFAILNVYYVIMGFVGIHNWKKERESNIDKNKKTIIINRLTKKDLYMSIAITIIGIPLLFFILSNLPKKDPAPLLDSIVTILSIIGTWWLTKSYIQQWWIWIFADIFAIWMNLVLINQGFPDKKPFVVQFVLCIISSFIGLWNWNRVGKYLNE